MNELYEFFDRESKKYTIIGFTISLIFHVLVLSLVFFGIPSNPVTQKSNQPIKIKIVTREYIIQPPKGKDKNKSINQQDRGFIASNVIQEEDFLKQNMHLPIEKIDFDFIKQKFYSYLIYPNIAQKNKWKGVVQVALTIDKNGKFLYARINKSSNRMILDDVVLYAAKQLKNIQLPKPKRNSTIMFNVIFSI